MLAVQALSNTVESTLESIRQKEMQERPGPIRRMRMVEYEYRGNEAEGDVMVEIACNPNAYANALHAKVFSLLLGLSENPPHGQKGQN